MASYRERILKAIELSEDGLTTVDVAKQAGVSKTTVIKYLSVLMSEGLCEFVEVGPSKLWRLKIPRSRTGGAEEGAPCEVESLSVTDLEGGSICQDATVSLSFKVKADQIDALMNQIKKYSHE
jgi:predicted ArsR family transcriptional regulator